MITVANGTDIWEVTPLLPDEIGAFNKESTEKKGLDAFKYLLNPIDVNTFFEEHWEKKHLLIKRESCPTIYDNLFSSSALDKMVRENSLQYSVNLDVTSYVDGVRKTHNPNGRVLAPVMWDHYNKGCSIRILNPQSFNENIWRLLSSLQEYFGSFCGANIYLTPPDSQGFAPHWDDIEAFILQVEGKKRWRVYAPQSSFEKLPRESSPNLTQEVLDEPILDVVLEKGDLLYFPRGFIHQGNTVDNTHSLHITISTYQKTSWVDLFEKLLPETLEKAAEIDPEFREGLPVGYLNYMGLVFSDDRNNLRQVFIDKVCFNCPFITM